MRPRRRTAEHEPLVVTSALPAATADRHKQASTGFQARLSRVMSLGRGAAYVVESPELARRHRALQPALQQAWWPHLVRIPFG